MNKIMIEAQNVHKKFFEKSNDVHILKGVNFTLQRQECVALLGASGSGKSTLLHLLGILDQSTSGEIFIDGLKMSRLSAEEQVRMRRDMIGFVFQKPYLLS